MSYVTPEEQAFRVRKAMRLADGFDFYCETIAKRQGVELTPEQRLTLARATTHAVWCEIADSIRITHPSEATVHVALAVMAERYASTDPFDDFNNPKENTTP